jgi:two-component system, OmpR family, phosphate regulon sensor histidine kinase PhoR
VNSGSSLRLKFLILFALPAFAVLWAVGFILIPGGGRRTVFSVLVAILYLLLYWRFGQLIIQPLDEIGGAVRRFTEGLFNWRIHLGYRKDELGSLGEDLNRLAAHMQERILKLSTDLAESEAILASMEEGVLILNPRGRVQKMNQAMETILIPSSSADIGKHYLEVFRDPDLNELIQLTLEGKQPQQRTIIPLGQPGKSFMIQSSLARESAGRVVGVVVVFHDVTNLKRLEKIRQDFVANVSHELRTPLTAIRGYTEALRDGAIEDTAQAEQFLRVIDRHTRRMDKIVADLLLLAEVESSERSWRMEMFSLGEVIHSAIDSLQPQADVKKQEIRVDLPATLPPLRGDGQKIHQVMINLLQNAINYTPEGGRIDVEAGTTEKGVEVSVADTGIGIPEEDLPRIFERFYRVDKSRSRDLGGTGLGLSIVKHIIDAHGGRVGVQSKLDKGSRFTFYLPQN